MSSPVTPQDLAALLPAADKDECQSVSQSLIEIPTKLWQIINWMLDSSGNPTSTFVKALGLVKPGDLIFSASPLDEVGRILCDGRTVSRTAYADLFAAIGTIYGAGDGSTTFQVPDYRNRFPVAAGTTYTLGQTGGEATHVLVNAELPSKPFGNNVAGVFLDKTGSTGTFDLSGDTPGTQSHGQAAWPGTDTPHENRPPFIACYVYLRT